MEERGLTRSHLINRSTWRGERFWPATRRDAGRILAAALTEEQRRGRPKDPPFLPRLRCTDFLIPIEIPVQNAAAGIYEMASNKDLVPLLDSRSRVSEVLSGRRTLSLKMIRALALGLRIPADVLLSR